MTLDDITTLAAARNDPQAFVRGFKGITIIDEVQRAPQLALTLKQRIDEIRLLPETQSKPRFILTGSANIMAIPQLADALVGRLRMLTLYPLSACEIWNINQTDGCAWPALRNFLHEAFERPAAQMNRSFDAEIIKRASFPGLSPSSPEQWFKNYISLILQRDVRDLMEIEKIAALPRLLNALSLRACGLMNDADLSRDAGLNAMTLKRYRILFEQLFLIQTIPAWFRQTGRRFVKAHKLYFNDTYLLAHLWGMQSLSPDHPWWGRMVENFVFTELIKQRDVSPGNFTIYHYRIHTGEEVDFVLELAGQKIVGMEVKSSHNVNAQDFKGLKALQADAGEKFQNGFVLYGGNEIIPFGEKLWAVPITNLFIG